MTMPHRAAALALLVLALAGSAAAAVTCSAGGDTWAGRRAECMRVAAEDCMRVAAHALFGSAAI